MAEQQLEHDDHASGTTVPPFRFVPAPGWPTPSAEWVELHQLWEPPAGWTPAPGVPPAPPRWRFWRTDPSGLLAFGGPRLRRLLVQQFVSGGIATLSFVAAVVLTVLGAGTGVILPAGLLVLAGVWFAVAATLRLRAVDRLRRQVRDDAANWRAWSVPDRASRRAAEMRATWMSLDQMVAAWSAEVWGTHVAAPAPDTGREATETFARRSRRSARTGTGLVVAIVATAVLVVGLGQIPAVLAAPAHAGSHVSSASGTAGSDSAGATAGLDEGSTKVHVRAAGASELSRYCGAPDDTTGTGSAAACWAFVFRSEADCRARATVDFSEAPGAPVTRTVSRTFEIEAGDVPSELIETGDEGYALVTKVTCHHDLSLHELEYDASGEIPDSAWPASCDTGTQCFGWSVAPTEDTVACPAAQAVFGASATRNGADRERVIETVPVGLDATSYVFFRSPQNWGNLEHLTCD